MGLFWFHPISMLYLLLLYPLFIFSVTNSFSSVQPPLCHEDESSSLLQFRQSLDIAKFASDSTLSFPKTVSWTQSTDCCSWDGVECDEQTGHVIGLDLSRSQLYGSIGSNSSLFHLFHLQRLNLSDNHFNYSQIPSSLGHLSRLTHLDLSSSMFYGEIPHEISQLSKLLVLNLSCNFVAANPQINLLQLKQQSFRSIIQNLTYLEKLYLGYVNISSPIPTSLTNLSSLQALDLTSTGVYGEFPIGVFDLPNLEILKVPSNHDLTGYLPASIGSLRALKVLEIWQCQFSRSIPSSLSNLTQLKVLDLGYNHFSGNLSSSLSNLTDLGRLSVGGNDITGGDISWIGKLNGLYYLDLSTTNISHEIPNSFANLTKLSYLVIRYANLIGQVPSWMMNFTNLSYLDLSGNKLHGEIPDSIFSLENLNSFYLGRNLLVGQLELDMLLNMKSLTHIYLSYNNLSVLTETSSFNSSFRTNILSVELAACNITEFPQLLKDQDQLEYLDLSYNKIHDTLPSWIWRKENLFVLIVSNNFFSGEISQSICNLKVLEFLDLSFNNISGTIPPCLGTSGKNLHALKSGNNKLSGYIPQAFMETNAFKMIDFSQNNLQGQLPKALTNCKMLKYLDVSNNHINDTFPFWLGTLPELIVLVLRSNKFFGVLSSPGAFMFPKMHIIDLSQNEFSGNLPLEFIQNWESMRASNPNELMYDGFYQYYKETGSIQAHPSATHEDESEDEDSWFPFEFDWKIIVIGYGGGLVFGLAMGSTYDWEKHALLWLKRVHRRVLRRCS
ncbi:Receptor-like protein 12 [Senna tora]|uniref:Receptor-like protein 12 n=1 Tax=Senna tora TaxID=362788 RepID=A0A834WLX4_9FABA|nr:Receptor-like protein 12 [Senna tora]